MGAKARGSGRKARRGRAPVTEGKKMPMRTMKEVEMSARMSPRDLSPLMLVPVWCGVVGCGGVWWGVVRCGGVWCGGVWCGGVWCGVMWCGEVCCGGSDENGGESDWAGNNLFSK